MKHGLKSWLTCALLLGMATRAIANDSPPTSLDQAQWSRLIASVKDTPAETLLNSRSPAPAPTQHERFAAAGAECFANAVALLNINDLLYGQPKSIRIGKRTVWNGKTAMFVSKRPYRWPGFPVPVSHRQGREARAHQAFAPRFAGQEIRDRDRCREIQLRREIERMLPFGSSALPAREF